MFTNYAAIFPNRLINRKICLLHHPKTTG